MKRYKVWLFHQWYYVRARNSREAKKLAVEEYITRRKAWGENKAELMRYAEATQY